MKEGFYYFSILDWYTIVYIKNKDEYNYSSLGVASSRTDSFDIEFGEISYIQKNSKTLNNYIYISNKKYEKWKEVLIRFLFEIK